jgi:serine/threonine-protein kinase
MLVQGGVTPRYAASGHLLYTNQATMFAIPFDIDKLETRGTAVSVLDDVAYDTVANGAQFDVSRSGTLVYRRSSGVASAMMRVQWLDAAGKQESLLGNPRTYAGTPHVSPDGRRVAITIRDGANQDVWVFDPQREAMTRLTHGGGIFANPLWSKDGRYVVFAWMGRGIWWSRADGAGQPQALLPSKTNLQFPASFTPDGKRLAYYQIDGYPQIWSVDVDDNAGALKAGKPVRFLTTQFNDIDPAFSPDGRWIAYSSNESGRPEVYVRPFSASPAGGEGKWQVSNSGGGFPGWSPNGRELLYRSGDQIMTVGYIASGGSFVAEKPRVWAANVANATGFDFAPDGKRVVVTVPASTQEPSKQEHTVVFVQNFFDELRRLAPVGP